MRWERDYHKQSVGEWVWVCAQPIPAGHAYTLYTPLMLSLVVNQIHTVQNVTATSPFVTHLSFELHLLMFTSAKTKGTP